MSNKDSIFYIEYKKLICKRNVVIISLICIFLLALMQIGINEYKAELKDIEISNKLEILKAKQFHKYTPYSVYGVRLHSMPSPMNFLLTFKIYGGLSAAVDTGTKLKIYEDKKGNNIFPDLSFGYLNFSGILLAFGSLLSLVITGLWF